MFTAPRGIADVLPEEQAHWDFVRGKLAQACRTYGYGRIDLPIFEQADLYVHGTGDSTDIVRKEMYIFEDRGGERMALRPEMTPNVCRAYLQHGLFNLPQPVKLYYEGPAFRYERPQSGRYRQFVQFGIEAIGEAAASLDAEVIEHAWRLYESMGLRNLVLQLNSIGDSNCRPAYVELLRAYYQDKLDQVCGDCRERFVRNPMRLLDCKVPICQPVIASAPTLGDHLCGPCSAHYAELQRYLQIASIPFTINPLLVRGLDYYTRTVFEIMPEDAGSQGTIGAGGRYDGLIEILGGKPTPAIGYASGIQRIIMSLRSQAIAVPEAAVPSVYVLHESQSAGAHAQVVEASVALANALRSAGVATVQAFGDRSLKSQMRQAGRSGARFAAIIGEEELANGNVLLRDLQTGDQVLLTRDALLGRLAGEPSQ
ncbi:MAG TPA: histidine--tRNA ligase [Dehalococcoidia bacterium]|nr:histidine--tRNA ligase [Dehalococcoidia bacterium]